MAVKDITSRDAVFAAIKDYDDLGQDAFLAKYGFKASKTTLLTHNGKPYDSKAILGVAHSFQFPEHGPLRFNDFHGGEETSRKLTELGFMVERAPNMSTGHSFHWVNLGDSYARARAAGQLWAPKEGKKGETYGHWSRVARLRPGDRVIAYAGGAVCAIARVKSQPLEADVESPDGSGVLVACWRADVEYFDLNPLPLAEISISTRKAEPVWGPFNKNGDVKQGYLFNLSERALAAIRAAQRGPWPDWIGVADIESASKVELGDPMSSPDIYDFLKSKNVHFPDELVTSYLLSLKTKPFVILSGISGTGKTKLAEYVAEWAGTTDVAVPEIGGATDEDSWIYRLRPYNFRHGRITVTRGHELLSFGDDGPVPIEIVFEGEGFVSSVRTAHPDGKLNLQVGLPKLLVAKLESRFELGDRVQIRIHEGEGEGLQRLEISALEGAASTTTTSRVTRHDFVSVRPDWLDNKGILGFYNLLSERYVATPFLKRLIAAFQDEQLDGAPHFITLDEMNLARVEHYFSDLLSATESRKPDVDQVKQEMLHLHDHEHCKPLVRINDDERPAACTGCSASLAEMRKCGLHPDDIAMVPPKLPVPTNVFITGTVNVDETTHGFSAKVLDRANVIEFNEVRLDGKFNETSTPFRLRNGTLSLCKVVPATSDHYQAMPAQARFHLETLHALLEPFHLHFGYRVANEIGLWLKNASEAVDGERHQVALDLQVLQKVLPKLHGPRQRLQDPLWKLLLFAAGVNAKTEFKTDHLELFRVALKTDKQPDLEAKTIGSGAALLPRSARKLVRMLKRLGDQGFVSFIE